MQDGLFLASSNDLDVLLGFIEYFTIASQTYSSSSLSGYSISIPETELFDLLLGIEVQM